MNELARWKEHIDDLMQRAETCRELSAQYDVGAGDRARCNGKWRAYEHAADLASRHLAAAELAHRHLAAAEAESQQAREWAAGLRARRLAAGMGMRKFAEFAEFLPSIYCLIENGRQIADKWTKDRIEKALAAAEAELGKPP